MGMKNDLMSSRTGFPSCPTFASSLAEAMSDLAHARASVRKPSLIFWSSVFIRIINFYVYFLVLFSVYYM